MKSSERNQVTWKKGQSGNPAGKPKGITNKYSLKELRKAVERVEKEFDHKLLDHFVEQAFYDNKVLGMLLKKFLPDLKHTDIDASLSTDGDVTFVVRRGSHGVTKPAD